MSRVKVLALVVVVAAGLGWSWVDDGPFTAAQARKLIPEAAGVPSKELQDIFQAPNPGALQPKNGDSLTWAVLHLQPAAAAKSFQFTDEVPNPAKLAQAVSGPKRLDGSFRAVATVIQPEYITDCTAKVDGDAATGVVTFKADGAYQGAVEYTARKKDGAWRVEEFRLPDLKVTLTLGADGKWVKK